MQLRTVAIVFSISCMSAAASAADVCYQYFADDENVEQTACNVVDPDVAIVDRAWLVPGLEQTDEYSAEYAPLARSRPEPRIERIVLLRQRYDELSSNAQDPVWDKNDLWPRTRQIWQRGEYYRQVRLENPEPVFISNIGLHR